MSAATKAERAAVKFEAMDLPFNWTNEDWTRHHLVSVRIASRLLAMDSTELQEAMAKMVKNGAAPEMLDSMCATRDNLKALTEMLDIALTRSFLVLERLGYGPDNPPPDNVVSIADRSAAS